MLVTDTKMQDALFLHSHPAWSPRDLDEADQDIVDLLDALHQEGARASATRNAMTESMARASRSH